jgi:hypothetical protein
VGWSTGLLRSHFRARGNAGSFLPSEGLDTRPSFVLRTCFRGDDTLEKIELEHDCAHKTLRSIFQFPDEERKFPLRSEKTPELINVFAISR